MSEQNDAAEICLNCKTSMLVDWVNKARAAVGILEERSNGLASTMPEMATYNLGKANGVLFALNLLRDCYSEREKDCTLVKTIFADPSIPRA